MAKKFAKVDPNVKMTNVIIALTKKDGLLPWMKGWNGVDGLNPTNFDHNTNYKGFFNNMILGMAANGRLPLFAPFSKAHPSKKGSKAIGIWKPIIGKDKKDLTKSKCYGFKVINVFHYTDLQGVDCEALEAKYAPKTDGTALIFNPITECEAVVASMPNCPSIDNNGGNSAFYRPSTDSVSMPKKDQFHNEAEYYCTLFHELAHSTGHFTRLDRFKKLGEEYKLNHKQDYSFEELVAELTACFIGSSLGIISDRKIENSAAYIKGWTSKLQSNTDWIMKASSYATKASNYILNKIKEEAKDSEDQAATA